MEVLVLLIRSCRISMTEGNDRITWRIQWGSRTDGVTDARDFQPDQWLICKGRCVDRGVSCGHTVTLYNLHDKTVF